MLKKFLLTRLQSTLSDKKTLKTMRKIQHLQSIVILLVVLATSTSSYGGWKTLTSVPTQGRWGATCFALNNKIYIGGGYVGNFQNRNDLISYDPSASGAAQWKFLTGMPSNANRTGAVSFVINGKAYVGLGADNYNNFSPPPTYFNDLWQYDDATDKWTAKKVLPDSGIADAAVFVLNNKAYVIGGERGATTSRKVWEYDPATDMWTAKSNYPAEVTNASGFAIGAKGYVLGGNFAGAPTNKLYEYDATTNIWKEKKSYPKNIWGGCAFTIGNKGYAGLGTDTGIGLNTTYNKDFFSYDPGTNNWSYWSGASIATGRMYAMAAVLGNKAYMGNGWTLGGTGEVFYNDFYSLDPADVVSVASVKSGSNLVIYPNPVKDILMIKGDVVDATYTLYDVAGRVVKSGVVSNNTIDMGNFISGLYNLEIRTDENIIRQSVIRE